MSVVRRGRGERVAEWPVCGPRLQCCSGERTERGAGVADAKGAPRKPRERGAHRGRGAKYQQLGPLSSSRLRPLSPPPGGGRPTVAILVQEFSAYGVRAHGWQVPWRRLPVFLSCRWGASLVGGRAEWYLAREEMARGGERQNARLFAKWVILDLTLVGGF